MSIVTNSAAFGIRAPYPGNRPRRMRKDAFSRRLMQENHLTADMLIQHINGFVAIAKKSANEESRHKTIKDSLLKYLLNIATQHGVELDEQQQIKLFKGDLEICAQGLGVWLDKEAQK